MLPISLFILACLFGYCTSQNTQDIILLTVQTLAQKQDTLLQKFDELAQRTSENEQQCNISTDSLTNILNSTIRTHQSALQDVIKDIIEEQFDAYCNRTIDNLVTKLQESSEHSSVKKKPVNCQGYKTMGYTTNGVYDIYPFNCKTSVEVWCDMDNGGWTVILSRKEQPIPENFQRGWTDYAVGFGNRAGEYWIGNDVLHHLTKSLPTTLRVEAEDYEGTQKIFGEWQEFAVGDGTSRYQLKVGKFAPAISTMRDPSMTYLNGAKFTTTDIDSDTAPGINCAVHYGGGGGGWWHKSCSNNTPTGIRANTDSLATSMVWFPWNPDRGGYVSLSSLVMKIKQNDSHGLVRMCQE